MYYKKVRKGETARIGCNSTSRVVWRFNGDKQIHSKFKLYLEIPNVSEKHIGVYECIGITRSKKTFYAQTRLSFYGKNIITLSTF